MFAYNLEIKQFVMIVLPHFGVENFRAFEGKKEFHFRDITFLIGANSTGKSSLVDSLNLASGKPLIEKYKLSNIINKNSKKGYFTISFPLVFFHYKDVKEFNSKFKFYYSNVFDNLSYDDCEPYFQYLNALSKLKFTLKFNAAKNNYIEVRLENEEFMTDLTNIYKSFENIDKSNFHFFKPFDDILNKIAYYVPRISEEFNISLELRQNTIMAFINEVFYFNSKFIMNLEEVKISHYNLIFLDKNEHVSNLFQLLNQAFTNIFSEFEGLNGNVIKYKNGEIYAGDLFDDTNDMEIESFFGKGMQRFVKLLYNNSEIFIDKHPKIILIEEPEANLHPNLQAKLADLFVEIINKFNVQLIIETHSEYLIRRMQYLIANTSQDANKDLPKITPEKVNIYYFNDPTKHDKEDHTYEIEFLKDGGLSRDFGEGFFDASLDLMMLLNEIRNNFKN